VHRFDTVLGGEHIRALGITGGDRRHGDTRRRARRANERRGRDSGSTEDTDA
jgi:hypothetical protein